MVIGSSSITSDRIFIECPEVNFENKTPFTPLQIGKLEILLK